MSTTMGTMPAKHAAEAELVSFYVGDLLLGAEISQVEEINRYSEPTPVQHAPDAVRGVVNLRGEVVTVLDLRTILGLGRTAAGRNTRNVIVKSDGTRTGLLVDRVADVVNVRWSEVDQPPANLSGVQSRFLLGVYKLENELLSVLNVSEALASADVVA
jgi:purine-binding chemotaxis protein CheW